MPFLTLNDLFESNEFKLPNIIKDRDKSFLYYFELKMKAFLQEIKKMPEDAFDSLNKDFTIDRLNIIIYELSKCLKVYLEGYPSHAYNHFKDLIKLADLSTELIEFRTIKLDSNSKFYRIKKEYNASNPSHSKLKNGFNSLVKVENLFHVPFEKRRAIGTNRFSIPGFPCIYLSDTLYTSWSECLEDAGEAFHAICFKNHRPLYIADLVPLNFAITESNKGESGTLYDQIDKQKVIIDYTFLYPLIYACHSKILYQGDYPGEKINFKSEYIIPQLLMQWYREKKLMIDGIRYLSCTAELKFPKSSFNKFNYVLPTIENCESGFCKSLSINFSTSRVYNYTQTSATKKIGPIINKAVAALNGEIFKPFI